MDAVENYGNIRGNARKFHINDEIFTVRKIPARIQMDFLSWQIEITRPKRPTNPDQVDPDVQYREDTRNEFEFILDACAETLNIARTQDQRTRFEVSVDWLLENVSADMLDKLVYGVMQPFLDRIEERKIEQMQKTVETQKAALEPAIREMVREEMKLLKRPSPSSAKSSENYAGSTNGQKSIAST